jgi:aldehyde dehydrogenase
MQIQEQLIADIAKEVVARLRVQLQQPVSSAAPVTRAAAPQDGVFATVDEAVNAAYEAQKKVGAMSLADRGRMTNIIVRICEERREELGRMEMEETKVGRLDHKILKLMNMRHVLSVDSMHSEARSDRTGLCVIEHAPWGVIGMMLPVTHSVAAPVGREGGAIRVAAIQPRDRAGTWGGERNHHHTRAQH